MSDIDKILSNKEAYTDKQVELAYFLQKLEWEGGVVGLIEYGGDAVFPDELKGNALDIQFKLDEFERQLTIVLEENEMTY